MTEEQARKLTSSRRAYLRKIGVDVPIFSKGQKKGYKQTSDHISKRIKHGEEHQNWKGDNITERSGRTRALRLYPKIGPCTICGNKKSERHHRDGNTTNNSPYNIVILCRKCHMTEDGRIKTFMNNRHSTK